MTAILNRQWLLMFSYFKKTTIIAHAMKFLSGYSRAIETQANTLRIDGIDGSRFPQYHSVVSLGIIIV